MKNLLEWIAWLVGAVGVLLLLLGVIARLSGGILFSHWWNSYFNAGVGFLILGIYFLLARLVCQPHTQE